MKRKGVKSKDAVPVEREFFGCIRPGSEGTFTPICSKSGLMEVDLQLEVGCIAAV